MSSGCFTDWHVPMFVTTAEVYTVPLLTLPYRDEFRWDEHGGRSDRRQSGRTGRRDCVQESVNIIRLSNNFKRWRRTL
jgi:hypothetical protein